MLPIKTFFQKVGNRRVDMIHFLMNHFRYNTMNSWNQSTSYANNVKIHKVTPDSIRAKVYSVYEQGDVYYTIHAILNDWGKKYNYEWQAKFNGKSGGYLVLYKGLLEISGYKTQCDSCGRLTYYETEQQCHAAECEGYLELLSQPHYDVFHCPGRSVDMHENFMEWDTNALRERVKLVLDFDLLCDSVVQQFIDFCLKYKVNEKVVQIPTKIKVLDPI